MAESGMWVNKVRNDRQADTAAELNQQTWCTHHISRRLVFFLVQAQLKSIV